jgi:hypothetical protein
MRFFRWFSLCILLSLSNIQSSIAAETPPSVMVQVASIDQLLKQLETLAKWSGKGEEAKQGIGFVRSLFSDKGIEGIATDRPIGFSIRFSENTFSSPLHIMIPISNQENFILFLKTRIRLDIKDGKNQGFAFPIPNLPFFGYGKFEHGYCYLTALAEANLESKELPIPKDFFDAKFNGIVRASLRMDRIPKPVKNLILGQFETQLVKAKAPKPEETKLQTEFKKVLVDSFAQGFKSFLNDTKELSINFGIDPKTEELVVESELDPVLNSFLQSSISAWKERTSSVQPALGSFDLIQTFLKLKLPESTIEAFSKVVDEAVTTTIDKAEGPAHDLVEKLAKALLPTLKQGELDVGLAVTPPNDKKLFTLLMSLQVKEGKGIEKALKEVVGSLPGEIQNWFEFDAKKVDGLDLHAFKAGDFIDANTARVVGQNAKLWFAVDDKQLIVSVGADAESILEKVVSARKSKPSNIALVQISMAKLAPFLEMEKSESIQAIVDTVFGTPAQNDLIRAELVPGEKLKFRVSIKGKVFQLFSALETLKQEEN